MSRIPSGDVRAAAPPDVPGYRFIRHLGAGGNAQVYLYEQQLPRREVAVKVLNEPALSDAARRRFTTEANVTAALSHRHIVQVFDAKVTDDGRPYLVMQFYPQPNLSVRARRAHFPVAEVLRTGIQVGGAVETSHRAGVLHRDIKPQNILTDSYGEPALTDFGIATTKGGNGPEGLSVPWSPPEILLGTDPGDERSDVYSLGATLWHLLAGRSPFERPDGDNKALALMGRIKSDPVPGTGRADVPASLDRLLRQAMAKDPAARPQTALELIRGLQSVEQELRLPVTQPILPSAGPAGDTPGDNTASIPAVRSGETTHRRGHHQAPGVQPGRPSYRDDGPATPGGEEAPTWARGPRRIDPWSPQPGISQPRISQPGISPQDPGRRARQFPQQAPEPATVARPRRIAPDGAVASGAAGAGSPGLPGAGSPGLAGFGRTERAASAVADPELGKSGRTRGLALAIGGAALAVVAGVAVLALHHGGPPGSSPGGTVYQTGTGGADNALGAGSGVPGTPVMNRPARLSGSRVEFSWTYSNPVPGDVAIWKQIGTPDAASHQASGRDFIVSAPSGQTVCYQVWINRDGVESAEPGQACWPD